MKSTKKTLLTSVLALFLCFAMLTGTTFAWFTDTVTSKSNVIQSGSLDAEMYWSDDLLAVDSTEWKNADGVPIFNHKNWEPGYTEVKYIKVKNAGNLSFKWQITIEPEGEVGKLAEVIDVYYVNPVENKLTSLDGLTSKGVLSDVIKNRTATSGVLLPEGETSTEQPVYETVIAIAFHMQESAGNDYQTESVGAGFSVKLIATQYSYENDAFGDEYDTEAEWPGNTNVGNSASADVNATNNLLNAAATMTSADGKISATAPAGVKVSDGVNKLTLTVTEMENSNANITVNDNEKSLSVDVHVDGVAEDNDVVIEVNIKELLPVGLNMGNYRFYHVEDGNTVEMTLLADGATPVHNNYKYDPATGDVTLYLKSFSEVALVAEPAKWEGKRDYTWYDASATELTIANADQLAGFSAIVGGMDGKTQDSFAGKTVKLVADIMIGDTHEYYTDASENGIVFYPIGYWNNEGTYERKPLEERTTAVSSGFYTFEGTFDGNGHTISDFYQNTWEMKGDHNWYDPIKEQYYRDGMGLFGKVYGGTVKNLTIENFSSDGEITTTGVIAAYADGATFENIAIFNCNPRVYNIGNGGIVGCVGWYAKEADLKTTFTNITVDNSNKISALWGSYDVACGGIVGQYYPTSGQTSAGTPKNAGIEFVNCHVSAIMDVYNDVCGNYQYYAYRYAGMIIGSIRENTTNEDGKTIPDMTGISATGCTVNYGDWNDYYYCEFEKNGHPSYSGPDDYKFSRVPHSELNFTDFNGNGLVDANERDSVTGCKHNHTDAENNKAIYLPFHQLFTGYGWGVNSIGLEKYSGIVTNLDITEGDQEASVEKFETKFTGDFLYRVGNKNTVSLGSLFAAKDGVTISNSGVWVKVEKLDENMNVSGTFDPNTNDWTEGTIQFSGTGVVKVTIQDYNFCTPTTLIVEVVDATNITSATGTTTGGDMVLLRDVNTSTYVNYWNCTLWGNGFTYSLNGAPTAYNSKQGHGILITKNATLDNLVIVGDIYDEYGAYTNNNDYNAAIDIMGDTVIQNCYISGCAAPVSTRANASITNTTLYGGAVANLLIKGGTVTLENVTTANYNDGRNAPIGMGIVIHSDATESAKLVLNGTLTQYNFLNEEDTPTDTYAKNLHTTMFGSNLSSYHFGTSPNRRVNTGIVSLTATFNEDDITDNANTGYNGTSVTLSGVNGYVYTQRNTSGSVNNGYDKENDSHVSTTQGAVPPSYSFDHTENYVAKTDGSNDYCYVENGIVYISMDDGDSFNYNTSILTLGKNLTDYTVSMNGVDYTGKSIAFDKAGDYEVVYTYIDVNNYKFDENGNITAYSETYTKTVNITVAVIKAATNHAEFTMGSSNAATEKITIDNTTYISATGVTADNSTWTYITINGQKIYYPIVAAKLTSTKGSSTYAYFPVFENVVTITDYEDNGTGDAFTYNSSTTTLPSALTAVKGIYKAASDVPYWYNLTNSNLTQSGASKIFKWASSSDAPSDPTTYNNVLCYKSPQISADRVAYITLVQYSYTDAANTTYYYYVGYTLEAFTKQTTCVTGDTLVTLADGTQKRIDQVTYADKLLAWDFFKGEYTAVSSAIIFDHGIGNNTVIELKFSDGTSVKVVNLHQFFDADLNKYVSIDADTVAQYVGHRFAKSNENGFNTVTLVDYTISNEYVEAWGIIASEHYNIFVEGMLSTDFMLEDYDLFNYFAVGEDMKFDSEQMQADIEEYGLYTYEEFADYLTYDQFVAFNVQYFKVAVGKGNYTFEGILALIEEYLN